MANLFLEKCLGNQTEVWGKDPKCSFCGELATGAWHGKENVYVCVSCATTILPKIIADATLFPNRNNSDQILKAIGGNFWKASSCLFEKRLAHKEKIEAESCKCRGGDKN